MGPNKYLRPTLSVILVLAVTAFTAFLTSAACSGAWVKNYDMSPTVSLTLRMNADASNQVKALLVELAEEHQFEYVIHNGETTGIREPGEFQILMRKQSMSVTATNTGSITELFVFFYKAVRKGARPTNEATQSLASTFADKLSSISGVTLEENTFVDRDK